MNFRSYLEDPAIGASSIKNALISPKYYKYYTQHKKETRSLFVGTAIHAAVFEPATFDAEYARSITKTIDTKANEQLRLSGKKVLTWSECDRIDRIKDEVLKMDFINKILRNPSTEIEKSYFAEHEPTGLKIKCRADVIIEGVGVIIDGKSCDTLTERKFTNQIIDHGYHISAAHYIDVLRKNNIDIKRFFFLAMEKKEPFHIMFFELEQEFIDYGMIQRERGLERIKRCQDANEWPGLEFCDDGVKRLSKTIKTPQWMLREMGLF